MPNRFQVTLVFRRSNRDLPFAPNKEIYRLHTKIAYENTGKILMKDSHMGGDRLTRTVVTLFDSVESYKEFSTDPVIIEMREARDKFCFENDIGITVMKQEIDDNGDIVSSESFKLPKEKTPAKEPTS